MSTATSSKSQPAAAAPRKPASLANKYLQVFNAFSAIMWGVVLIRLLVLYPLVGHDFVSEGVAVFLSWTQTLAVLEVFHALIGIVRSNPLTVAMQVASRLFVVWGVVRLFPQSASHQAFSTMVLAWSITELIRYPYYWAQLRGETPKWLEWIRYTFFIVLYPLGASSEMIITYFALPVASFYHPHFSLLMKLVLIIYPPSFYVLYMHMFKMRHKVQQLAARKQQ